MNKPFRSTVFVALVIGGLLTGSCSASPAPGAASGAEVAPLVIDLTAPPAQRADDALASAAQVIADTAPLPIVQQLDASDAPLPPIGPVDIGRMINARRPVMAAPPVAPVVAPEQNTDAAAAPATTSGGGEPAPELPRVDTPTGPAFQWSETENYLVLGTDRREGGESWRTDSIMVVGLDRANNRAAVFSVPRDLYVEIPGYGWGRINQADYMGEQREPGGGGPALVSGILEKNLGISTSHWVRIQMDGFVRFIDALGGVDIYLDCPFAEPIFNVATDSWEEFTLPAGESHLDGQDAYWFARLRYRESDIGRSSRQRAIIWALRDKVLSSDALLRLPELYAAFQDTISTDLSLIDMIALAQVGGSLNAENVRAGGLTLKDLQNYVTPNGAQVLVIADAGRVRSIVEGVWDAPAMADAYRRDAAKCPAPMGEFVPPVDPTPAPAAEAAPEGAGAPAAEGTGEAAAEPTAEPVAEEPAPEPTAEPTAAPVEEAPPTEAVLPTPTPQPEGD